MDSDPKNAMKTAIAPHPAARVHHSRRPVPVAHAPPPVKDQLSETLQRHWPFFKTVFKEQYMVLTDDDLTYTAGHEEEFLEHLERKTCRPRDEFEKLITTMEVPTL